MRGQLFTREGLKHKHRSGVNTFTAFNTHFLIHYGHKHDTYQHFKGIVHFEICFWYVLATQGHPRCRCVCFRSSFNFDIFWSNRSCLSVI